ncbi:hypothetical protein [Azospirillum endophyticum]|nr:hypothetical protein [Azospirillum endophyticum]
MADLIRLRHADPRCRRIEGLLGRADVTILLPGLRRERQRSDAE